jgi:hypothetical protein
MLQSATRYTLLRRLPPVLHISLLRFVFDLTSMERKKSKDTVSIPLVLDMSPFVSTGENAHLDTACVYHLRGILKHRGARYVR